MNRILDLLLDGVDLAESDARLLLSELTSEDLSPAVAGAVLAALRLKGETAEEVRGFAMGLREKATDPDLGDVSDTVDVVGTGGDNSGSLNLSTGAAIVAAAAGQRVVKHGNRAVSSKSGSADVLTAIGLEIPLSNGQARLCLEETGFTFLFAPHHHPAMRHVAPVRSALGTRTIFNLIGPLANPAGAPFAVIGAPSPEIARTLAAALSGMPLRRAFVVHGADGWDEPTPMGEYLLLDVSPGSVEASFEDPLDLGIDRCEASTLTGGDASSNAAALRRVLDGETGPHRDALVLGASLALRVTGFEESLQRAVAKAGSAIDDGSALQVFEDLATFSERNPNE